MQMDVAHALKGHSSGSLMGSFWSEQQQFTVFEMFSFFSLYDRLAHKASEKQHEARSLIRRTLFSCVLRGRCDREECTDDKCVFKSVQRAIVIFLFLTLIHSVLLWVFFFWEIDKAARLAAGDFFAEHDDSRQSHFLLHVVRPPFPKSQTSAISQ